MYPIDNAPPPAEKPKSGKGCFKRKYPFVELQLGEGFYLEKTKNDIFIARGLCKYWTEKLELDFWYRRGEDGRVKIWRVE